MQLISTTVDNIFEQLPKHIEKESCPHCGDKPKTLHRNKNHLYLKCVECNRCWCLLSKCYTEFNTEDSCRNHIQEVHDTPAIHFFNFSTNVKCHCDPGLDKNIFGNRSKLGLCGTCQGYYCLSNPRCMNKKYTSLIDCIDHQLTKHSSESRRQATVVARFCDNCGVKRYEGQQILQLYQDRTYCSCNNCGIIWCLIKLCNEEFESLELLNAHVRKYHG